MGQESGEIWTAETLLQPILPKCDRLLDCLSILFGILEIKIYKRVVGQPSSLLALLTWANWTIRSSIPDKHGT
jgi:hypothetical protein